ncbi:uncharacterized protein MYCFIDRAFT_172589 [Pseudocercospora fijiensis CIRAD86]|uniref:Myb-like domain-containing protein n=1 Tax=Pseudocercospora fijiensis (strain CIRAD86) TaxID=383855 RepID=M2ZAP5_PSEFD|nr:uncharacterized protein MYCFIDRAFT_172589 [Pseudocercospora fijiensis CIRAD86]EME86895.1 hypothetical protein MYCFIDRAFT_172589 [Pseudocercospora fijiensis CIRAD86]
MSIVWNCISRPFLRHARRQPYHHNWLPTTQMLQNHYNPVLNASRWLSGTANAFAAWAKDEVDLLLQLREMSVPYRDIAERLGRAQRAVMSQASRLRREEQRAKGCVAGLTLKYWSKEELSTLKDLRANGRTCKEIAAVLDRSIPGIRGALARQRVASNDQSRTNSLWTTEDKATLMAMRNDGCSWAMVASALKRSTGSVMLWSHLRCDVNLTRRFFTKEEDELLLRLKVDEKKSWGQIALAFENSRGINHLRDRFRNLQTTALAGRSPATQRPWTENDVATLRQLVSSSATYASIALQLGRSRSAVCGAIKLHQFKEARIRRVLWSPEQESALFHYRRDLCMSFPEIAAILGRTEVAHRSRISPDTTIEKNEHEALEHALHLCTGSEIRVGGTRWTSNYSLVLSDNGNSDDRQIRQRTTGPSPSVELVEEPACSRLQNCFVHPV